MKPILLQEKSFRDKMRLYRKFGTRCGSTNWGTDTQTIALSLLLSWWILFIGVRQVVTLTMALITQALVIDYLALGSRFSLKWLGPLPTLLIVQSKGWPFVSIFWGKQK